MISLRACLPLFAALAANLAAQPAISIVSTPTYGFAGNLTGQVTGITPAGNEAAIYILIEGLGWWSKPTATNPSVPIQPNGSFSANVVTGGLDAYATIYYVVLLPPGVAAPVVLGAPAIPSTPQAFATTWSFRPGRVITFAGRQWAVKDGPQPVDPGANYFSSSPNDVFVDGSARLHLTLTRQGNVWYSSEVFLLESLGYGTYWFTTEYQVNLLDANVTFGAFLWDNFGDAPAPGDRHREIDFEDGRWGNPSTPTSSQWVVQPFTVPGNLMRYLIPTLPPPPKVTRYFRWSPTEIEFIAVDGEQSPCMAAWQPAYVRDTYLHAPALSHYVPPAGRETFRFNLWSFAGPITGPASNQNVEVIISDFRFAPDQGVFPTGCYVNPTNSLSLLAGAPVLGTTFTLGADNPLNTQSPGSLVVFLASQLTTTNFPCGTLVPGFGMAGGAGELLLDPNSIATGLASMLWTGGPVPLSLSLPNTPALIGDGFHFQALLLDPTIGATQVFALTSALELCLR